MAEKGAPSSQGSGITAEQPVALTFGKGIDESQSSSVLPEGFLVSCLNWTPQPTGALRARQGWIAGPNAREAGETHVYPTTRNVRGIGYTGAGNGPWWAVAMINNESGDTLKQQVWAIKSDFSGGWWRIAGGELGDWNAYPVAFAVGGGEGWLVWSHPALSNMRRWDGTTPPADPPLFFASMTDPGRCLAQHKSRLFSGGGNNKPYRLYYSNLGATGGWDMATQYIDIRQDDGEAIEDICSFQGELIIVKRSSAWILTGSGADTFNLTSLDGASGARGRVLVPTPSGLVILGETEAWIWNGGDPQLISPPVQGTYTANAGQPKWRMGAYAGGKVYVSGNNANQPTLVFDVGTGAWSTENAGADTETMICVDSQNSRLVGGPRGSTISPPLVYRDVPFGARVKDFTTVSPTFSVRTPDFWLTKARQPMTLRYLWVRVRQRTGTLGDNALVVTPYVDGVATPAKSIAAVAGGTRVFYARCEVGKTGRAIGIGASTTVPGSGGALWDIEEVIADVDIAPPQ